MSASPAYEEIAVALDTAGSEIGAAECHGMFCGVLCTNGQLDTDAMAAQVVGGAAERGDAGHDAAQKIGSLLAHTAAQLKGEDFDLKLVLPADSESLALRSEALGLWCQGFMMGLSAGGLTQDTEINSDARELLTDFANISRTLQDTESLVDAGGDDEEAAFAEVEEYVRVGVLFINEELRTLQPEPQVH